MDEKEIELIEKLDEIMEEVRKLREGLDDDKEDREGDPEDENGEAREDEPTEEEVLAKIDELLEDYESTEKRLKKLQARSARFAAIHTRHAERANTNDRVGAPIMPNTDRVNTRNGRHVYNINKALAEYHAQRNGEGKLTGLEAETQAEFRKRRPASRGLILPFSAPVKSRALDMTTGAGAITEEVYPTIIDVLRNRLVLAKLGAPVFEFDSPTKLPKASEATAYWGRTAPTKSSPGLAGLSFTPYQVGARVTIDRGMLLYSQVDSQGFVVNQLTNVIAQAIQTAAFHGTGEGDNMPLGLFGYTSTDVNVVALGTNGAALDRAKLLQLVAASDASNASDATQAFVSSSKVFGKLEGTVVESGFPTFLYEPVSKTILGRPAAATNSIRDDLTKGTSEDKCSAIAFGAWEEMALAVFGGGLEVLFDDISGQDGSVTVTVLSDADIQLLHGKAFSIATDVLTS